VRGTSKAPSTASSPSESMPRRFHDRFGTAGAIVAVIALVAALGGTALAASGALSGKQKKEVEKIAKKFAGKPGAAGPVGPAGPAGAKGDTGAVGSNGTNGTNGTNGVSPTGTTFSGSKGGCTEGGVEFKGANTTFACNGVKGANGTTGFTETLPPGKTETGAWGGFVPSLTVGDQAQIPISFPIPLPGPGAAFVFTQEQTELEIFGRKGGLGCVVGTEGCVDTGCRGTIEHPTAPPGVLCVYTAHEENKDMTEGSPSLNGEPGFLPSGTLFRFTAQPPGPGHFDMNGSWAVTAPTS
jgi:hypothetical protein